jgi:hypothetical protein
LPKLKPGVGARAPGAAHDNVDVAAPAAGNEGLGAIQDVVVAVARGPGLEPGRVGAGVRFGQAIAGEMFHRRQPGQKPAALRIVAEAVDHPGRHVVDRDVGGGRGAGGGQFLEHDRRVQAREPRPADVVAHIQPGETERRGGAQGLLGEGLVPVPAGRVGRHLLRREGARGALERTLFLGKLEIHGPAPLAPSGGDHRNAAGPVNRAPGRDPYKARTCA